MEGVEAAAEDAVLRCRRILGPNGRLNTAVPEFVSREQQVELSASIAEAIQAKSVLVAEAGTGTGKTFAYLVPCLLSGKKTVISTATKTLQDQLFQKDLPLLIRALGLSTRVQNLKGRANYLCRYRVALHAEEGRFTDPSVAHEVLHVRDKLSQLTEGVRGELPELTEESSVWPYVTSTADNCLGSQCSYFQDCFLVKARQRAMKADMVVINHHLFFADSELKLTGFGELLPGVDIIIFDEAHQLESIATHFHGKQVSTRQLVTLFDEVLREWPVLDLANQPFKQLKHELDETISQLIVSLPDKEERHPFENMLRLRDFHEGWLRLQRIVSDTAQCFTTESIKDQAGLIQCLTRLDEIQDLMRTLDEGPSDMIRWLERFKQSLTFHATPVDVAAFFQGFMARHQGTTVFTSATLTMAASFDCFLKALGLVNVSTVALPSPFNFYEQALLYLPRELPDPKDNTYYSALLSKVLPVIDACGGRCFFLFTSYRALNAVASQLINRLKYPLLIQGEEAKPILLARFRQLGNAVLLGTATFWEGIDVKGEALSCVIIDKLPFSSPSDPVTRGKMAYLKSQGLSGFSQHALPNAVLALKQGVGRLIRDATDKGVLVIADPRLTGRDYGRTIFASLPSMRKTRDEETVLAFISTLNLTREFNHEFISD